MFNKSGRTKKKLGMGSSSEFGGKGSQAAKALPGADTCSKGY